MQTEGSTMNRQSLPQRAAVVAFGLAALAATGVAQARSDVHFSISVQPSHIYVPPQPVYLQPQPVFVQTRTVHVLAQPIYVQQHGHNARRGPWGDRDGDGVPNLHDRDHPRNHWRQADRPHHGWYRY
jgi:hypothetical protein